MITEKDVTEFETFQFITEASTIGIGVGQIYPRFLPTTLGNGQPFVHQRADADGAHHYLQSMGCITLKVIND